jgi:hypothetical protein
MIGWHCALTVRTCAPSRGQVTVSAPREHQPLRNRTNFYGGWFMHSLRMVLLILVCYLAGTVTADLLVPIVFESQPAASAGDVARLGNTHTSVQSSHTGSSEAASEL